MKVKSLLRLDKESQLLKEGVSYNSWDFIPVEQIKTMLEYLTEFHDEGVLDKKTLPKIKDHDIQWLFNQLLEIIKELDRLGIDTMDYQNPLNLGLKRSGELAMFDMGFGHCFNEKSFDILDGGNTDNRQKQNFNESQELTEDELKLDRSVQDRIFHLLGYSNYKLIGNGTFGNAYAVGENKIVKLTTDRSEAINSKALIGKSSRHLAEIYSVKQYAMPKGQRADMRFSTDEGGGILYIIILERLREGKKVQALFRKAMGFFESKQEHHFYPQIVKAIKKKNAYIGEMLETLYKHSYEDAWEIFLQKGFSEDKLPQGVEANDICDLASWIQGSKSNHWPQDKDIPEYVIDTADKLLEL